jgi:hypothetical protein
MIEIRREMRIRIAPETVPRHLHIALTAVAIVHIG